MRIYESSAIFLSRSCIIWLRNSWSIYFHFSLIFRVSIRFFRRMSRFFTFVYACMRSFSSGYFVENRTLISFMSCFALGMTINDTIEVSISCLSFMASCSRPSVFRLISRLSLFHFSFVSIVWAEEVLGSLVSFSLLAAEAERLLSKIPPLVSIEIAENKKRVYDMRSIGYREFYRKQILNVEI